MASFSDTDATPALCYSYTGAAVNILKLKKITVNEPCSYITARFCGLSLSLSLFLSLFKATSAKEFTQQILIKNSYIPLLPLTISTLFLSISLSLPPPPPPPPPPHIHTHKLGNLFLTLTKQTSIADETKSTVVAQLIPDLRLLRFSEQGTHHVKQETKRKKERKKEKEGEGERAPPWAHVSLRLGKWVENREHLIFIDILSEGVFLMFF